VLAIPLVAHYDLVFQGKSLYARGFYNSGQCGGLVSDRFKNPSPPAFVISDPESGAIFNEPVAYQIGQRLWKGELPFWSTDAGPGAPLLTNNQAGAFFPLNWISYLIPTGRGIDLTILARLLACFYFCYLALRRGFGLGKLASLAGATVYGLTGNVFLKGNMGTPAIYAVFPLYVWAVRKLHTPEIRWRAIVGVAVTTSLIFFAGFPEAALGAFYLGLALHLEVFLRPARKEAGHPSRWNHLGRGVMDYTLGGLLAAPALLPLLQAMSLLPPGYRVGMGLHGVTPPSLIRNLLVPVVERWPEAHQPGWITWVPMVLALVGILSILRARQPAPDSVLLAPVAGPVISRRETWVLIGLATLYALKTVQFPGIQQAMMFIPFVNITHPSRDLSLWWFFPIALFTAQAVHLWSELGEERKRWTAAGIVAATTLFTIGLMVAYKESPAPSLALFFFHNRGTTLTAAIALVWSFYFLLPRTREYFTPHFERIAITIFLLLSIVASLPRGKPRHDDFDPSQPLPLLQAPFAASLGPHPRIAHFWPQSRCTAEWSGAFGYGAWNSVDPLMPERQLWFMHAFFDCLDAGCLYGIRGAKTKDPLFPWRISAAEHLVDVTGQVKTELNIAWSDPARNVTVYRDPAALPRSFTTRLCKVFPRFEDVYATLKAEEKIPSIAYLDEGAGARGHFPLNDDVRKHCELSTTFQPQPPAIPVTPTVRTNTLVRFEVLSVEPQLLVLADLIHPDWVAKVDGVQVGQYPAFGMYRGVFLKTGGAHRVDFEYVPRPFYFGSVLAVFGLFLMLGVVLRLR
ncbi:MAG: hypothetical protein AAB425_00145, partial [Bdellovibrionota bacterium]